jgi:hypothetical protein
MLRIPLSVKRRLSDVALIDADGVVIAITPTRDWSGVAENERPEIAQANLEEIASRLNASLAR